MYTFTLDYIVPFFDKKQSENALPSSWINFVILSMDTISSIQHETTISILLFLSPSLCFSMNCIVQSFLIRYLNFHFEYNEIIQLLICFTMSYWLWYDYKIEFQQRMTIGFSTFFFLQQKNFHPLDQSGSFLKIFSNQNVFFLCSEFELNWTKIIHFPNNPLRYRHSSITNMELILTPSLFEFINFCHNSCSNSLLDITAKFPTFRWHVVSLINSYFSKI